MESQQRSNTLSRTRFQCETQKIIFNYESWATFFFGKSTLFRKIKKYQKEIYLRLIFFQYNIGIKEYIYFKNFKIVQLKRFFKNIN